MEYTLTMGERIASCSCGHFTVDLQNKTSDEKIKKHVEAHGAEPEPVVIVREAWSS